MCSVVLFTVYCFSQKYNNSCSFLFENNIDVFQLNVFMSFRHPVRHLGRVKWKSAFEHAQKAPI